MLKYFSVENFKQFANKIEIDFSDVRDYKFNEQCIKNGFIKDILVYGKNASGKSNLGLAIMDITNHLVDKEKLPFLYDYYLNADSINKPASFKYIFSFGEDEVVYEYQKINFVNLITESLTINGENIFYYNFQTQKFENNNLKIIYIDNLNWIFKSGNISVLRYIANNTALNINSIISKLIRFVEGMLWFRRLDNANNFIGYKDPSSYGDIIEYLHEKNLICDFEKFLQDSGVKEKVEFIKGPDGRNNLYFIHKGQNLPLSVASSGTKALLLFYTWYKQLEQATFVIIGEFDAFYHFELAERIVNILIQKVEAQVLLTSHNTNLLTNRLMRPDCYFILNEKGLNSFANSTKREIREGNNVEKLFISGEFGE